MATKFTITPANTYEDGSQIPDGVMQTITFSVQIDTVNPPAAAPIAVPAAAAKKNADGSYSVLFADIGFKPAPNVKYFIDASETVTLPDGSKQTSGYTGVLTFTNTVAPKAPTGFSVS